MESVLLDSLKSYLDRPRWVVAFSGGLDSTVLLHALNALPERPELHALHIHHGLQSEADSWQRHCEDFARHHGIGCSALKVSVEDSASIEEAARRARYEAFEQFLNPGDVLLQAHHLDDQAETLLLRFFRGTGLEGLRGMPAARDLGEAVLVRPLLDVSRRELEDYAAQHQLAWIEDPSNRDTGFDRNYLRHKILPQVEARWPGYRTTLARLAGLAATALPDDAVSNLTFHSRKSTWSALDLDALRSLDEGSRNAALRQWLGQAGITPSLAQLQALQKSMLWSSPDAEPVFELGPFQVRRFQEVLYITRLTSFDPELEVSWDGGAALELPGAGTLSALGGDQPERFTVRFRRGGERCQPAGRAHSQRLKKLLQESHIPPWRRDRLPLIYLDGELAAVADLWICADFAERLAGWRFAWEPEG
ncbi:tRNA(Ile)-lysidine synthase [Litorivivens lipolytica]|uniref:tRNA(Ile)-lysidine synthase n=1 Tax=Litorivivens lipolytica TaxID=1524264 RepID=A0A7W4W205_9GAMM|nr:tRNA lysidine(34) synthetase TilS [Litorivivens lipolytica]MBB3045939.1 tRNA(Ile)-lysidine synthase [Litorivivens lipolytica]